MCSPENYGLKALFGVIITNISNSYSHRNGLKVVRTEDFETAFEITVEPENKAVAQAMDFYFKTVLHGKYRSGISSLHVLDEMALVIPGGCGFKNFSPFYDTFNDVIGQQIAAGFANAFDDVLSPKIGTKADEVGPQVLTMEHLGLGFIACLIPLGLSTAVFLMEVVLHWLNTTRKVYPQLSLMNLDKTGLENHMLSFMKQRTSIESLTGFEN